MAAALLHDVGKLEAGIGTFTRVAVTLMALAAGRERLLAAAAGGRRGTRWLRRPGLYLVHDRLGAEMLQRAGSHDLTVSWTREHHLDPARWSLEPRLSAALKAADGD
jgi:hypothetical protein